MRRGGEAFSPQSGGSSALCEGQGEAQVECGGGISPLPAEKGRERRRLCVEDRSTLCVGEEALFLNPRCRAAAERHFGGGYLLEKCCYGVLSLPSSPPLTDGL